VGSRMRVCLLGTGGAANEARHQAGVLVEWGEGARGGRILLDTGVGLDIVRLLIAAKSEPTEVRDIFVSHQHMDHVGGLEPLLLWSIIRTLGKQGCPPSDETRVYADWRVLEDIEELFGAIATAVPLGRLDPRRLHEVEGEHAHAIARRLLANGDLEVRA